MLNVNKQDLISIDTDMKNKPFENILNSSK